MALVTATQFKAHYETDLGDEAIERLLDAEEQEIIARYGEHLSQTQTAWPERLTRIVYLNRPGLSITTVTERLGDDDTTLAADDYELLANGTRLDRLTTGTNPGSTWGDRVSVFYVPVEGSERRIRVLIDLCKLAIAYQAETSEGVGDYKASYPEYQREREAILSTLNAGARWWA